MSVGPKPVRQSLLTGHVRIKHIRVSGCDNGVEDVPDGIVIGLGCRAGGAAEHQAPNVRVDEPAFGQSNSRTGGGVGAPGLPPAMAPNPAAPSRGLTATYCP